MGAAVVVERSELQLVWPADLFAREAQALLDAGCDDEDTMGWLLSEAFHGDRGLKLYRELDSISPHPVGIDAAVRSAGVP